MLKAQSTNNSYKKLKAINSERPKPKKKSNKGDCGCGN